jgi:hypothetical protein
MDGAILRIGGNTVRVAIETMPMTLHEVLAGKKLLPLRIVMLGFYRSNELHVGRVATQRVATFFRVVVEVHVLYFLCIVATNQCLSAYTSEHLQLSFKYMHCDLSIPRFANWT